MRSMRTRAALMAAVAAVAAGLANGPAARAADRTWDDGGNANAAAANLWREGVNWSADTVPNATDDRALFTGTGIAGATVEAVNLVAADGTTPGAYTLNQLNFSNATGANYTLANGALTLNSINQTADDPNALLPTVTVAALANDLAFNVTSNTLGIQGQVTAAGTLTKNGGSTLRLGINTTASANAIGGDVIVVDGTLTAVAGSAAGSNPLGGAGTRVVMRGNNETLSLAAQTNFDFVRDVVLEAAATLDARAATGDPGDFTMTVGTVTLPAVTLRTTGANGYFLQVDGINLTGDATLNVESARLTTGAITGASGFTKVGGSELRLEAANTFAGTMTLLNGQTVTRLAGTAGAGSVVVGSAAQPGNQNPVFRVETADTFANMVAGSTVTLNGSATGGSGSLFLANAANLTTFPQVAVNAYGVLSGNLNGAVYSGAGQNVTFADNAILAPNAGTPEPISTDLPTGVRLFRGVINGTQSVDLTATGDVYRAVAYGAFTTNDASGTLTAPAGADLNIRMLTGRPFTATTDDPATAAVPAFNTQTGVVNVTGPGNLTMNVRGANAEAVAGNWTTINRSGDASLQNTDLIAFDSFNPTGDTVADTGDAVPVGKTVNVANGRVRFYDVPGHVAGTVNLNNGASLWLTNIAPTTGTFNLNAPAAGQVPTTLVTNNADRLNGGAAVNIAPGTLVVLDADLDTQVANIPENVDIQVSDDLFPGKGLVIGQGRRLTAGANESVTVNPSNPAATPPVVGTPEVRAAAGATGITFSAGNNQGLTLNVPVNLAGVNLAVNDPTGTVGNMVNSGGDTNRPTAGQFGEVNINGFFRAASVTLQGAPGHTTATTGQGDISVFVLNGADQNVSGNITVNSGSLFLGGGGESNSEGNLTPRLTTTSTAVADRVADNIVIGTGGLVEVGLDFPATGTRQSVTQPFTIAGGVDPGDRRTFFVTRTSGTAALGVDFQRVTMNDGAVLGFQESNSDVRTSLVMAGNGTMIKGTVSNFDLINVTSSAPGTPRTLTVGGLDTAFDATVNIFGTISSDVTVNVTANRTAATALGITAGSTGTVNGTVDLNSTTATPRSFAANGRLAGTGSIADGLVTVGATGRVAPGTSPGTLTVPNIDFAPLSTLEIEMDGLAAGSQYDVLNVVGTADVAGANLVALLGSGFVPADGTRFTILTNDGTDPVTGTFAQGSVLTAAGTAFEINYAGGDGNDIVLTANSAVPEPAGVAAVGTAALGLLAGRRRRRR